MADKTYSIEGLTFAQKYIIEDIIRTLQDCMQYDESADLYSDDGTFLYCCGTKDYVELMSIEF